MIANASGEALRKVGFGLIGDVLCFIFKISKITTEGSYLLIGARWDYKCLLYCVLYFSADLNILQMKKKIYQKKKKTSVTLSPQTLPVLHFL